MRTGSLVFVLSCLLWKTCFGIEHTNDAVASVAVHSRVAVLRTTLRTISSSSAANRGGDNETEPQSRRRALRRRLQGDDNDLDLSFLYDTATDEWSQEQWAVFGGLVAVLVLLCGCACCCCVIPALCCGGGGGGGGTSCLRDLICLWCCWELCCSDNVAGGGDYDAW